MSEVGGVVCVVATLTSNMGEAALRSHAKGSKHIELVSLRKSGQCCQVDEFFRGGGSKDKPPSSEKESTQPMTVETFASGNDCRLRAEILWAMKVIKSHYYRSCSDIGQLFATMFPDSDTAQRFSCGEK